ncbi:YycC family protein [Paenibacillus hemerocallicola]|jgi:plasmid maintenance system antidote protein VapI|uniref:YycC family protein n=1 Tax=Paenibacillus hemerocallicola TaxID=1172614 RepID=A0A5C4T8D8_9BACL|nr:YycC family protein [Paenibacillus hemerocallicola]TNJ64657.1 YycC family protein [Paenibacillus hemerocallicola]
MRPLQISPETAIKLAEALNVPIERLMHMPQHILIQKLAELAQTETTGNADKSAERKE